MADGVGIEQALELKGAEEPKSADCPQNQALSPIWVLDFFRNHGKLPGRKEAEMHLLDRVFMWLVLDFGAGPWTALIIMLFTAFWAFFFIYRFFGYFPIPCLVLSIFSLVAFVGVWYDLPNYLGVSLLLVTIGLFGLRGPPAGHVSPEARNALARMQELEKQANNELKVEMEVNRRLMKYDPTRRGS